MLINHIYWFTYYSSVSPSTRSRGENPLKIFHERFNISYNIVYPGYSLKNILDFLSIYFQVLFFRKQSSLLVIQKIHSNRLYANTLKILLFFRKKNTLYDLDDAEYLRHPVGSLHYFIKNCALVSVSSRELEKYTLQFNNKVFINTSPVTDHPCVKTQLSDKLTIGWVGDYGNGNDISFEFSHKRGINELVFPAVRELEFPVRLVLIGISKEQDILAIKQYFKDAGHVELVIPENIDWRDETWLYRQICKFDIGLSPLIDHEFNRAKSAYKIKQYLSCGVPVLASSVGENANFVIDGMNGFFCDSPGDYSSRLKYFAGLDREKYLEMSKNALSSSHSFRTEKYCEELIQYCQAF